jgi:hypothetical protein
LGSACGAGGGPVTYWFAIARDQVKFVQDAFTVILFVDIEPDVPHTYRLELYGEAAYVWYIDSEIVHADVPGGPYPAHTPRITWRARSAFLESSMKWDYVRCGPIPQPASGDFDSDGAVDSQDLYFFEDCLLGPDADGPGCRWADMNGDRQVNGADIEGFVDALLAGQPPPPPAGQEQASPPRPGVHSVNFDAPPGEQSVNFDARPGR